MGPGKSARVGYHTRFCALDLEVLGENIAVSRDQ